MRIPKRLLMLAGSAFLLALSIGCGGESSVQPSSTSSPASLAFAPRIDLSTDGTKPGSVVLADFNLCVAGQRGGTFAPTQTLPSGSISGAYFGIAVADFNGDKIPDIAAAADVASGVGKLLIYAGNGDGTFQAPVTIALPSSFPTSLANADFNGNGKQDLLVGYAGTANIETGNGASTFQTSTPVYNTSLTMNIAINVQTADLDADGKPDLLLADYNAGTLTMIVNGAIGSFFPATGTYQFQIAPGLNDIAVGDLNGDGLPDVVVSHGLINQISIFLSEKQ